jgi:hypothetical protein
MFGSGLKNIQSLKYLVVPILHSILLIIGVQNNLLDEEFDREKKFSKSIQKLYL